MELPKRFDFKAIDEKWTKCWVDENYFHATPKAEKTPYTIVIPPPNVTGILHMGHALNNTLQDIIIRYKRMNGYEACWMPGTDHAGIATQNVVEKQLAKEGKTRHDVGREKLLERLWDWKQQYGDTIIHQLEKLGASCDWPRTSFTMDENYSHAVKKVFIDLYNKGLIYQGERIINWCPRCHTALSDEEAEHEEKQGTLTHIKYPLKDNPNEFITVATTRPETMLGDTAVAVNPNDDRYKKYIGKTLVLPLMDREIQVIADEFVDPAFGTGAVKVTPAHDPNDFQMGERHNLEMINIMNHDGVLNAKAGTFEGQDRFDARKAVVKALKEINLIVKVEDHTHAVGHCYRCHTIVEPYLSKQWFVKMAPLAKPALEVVQSGKVKFYPDRWTKTYTNWMENIRDWCIS
ncbi:MAG: valine--tRNA ligase, partial [Candidatus Omnitrophica bacterium]|nr:valine--tRNA ligase [Candidatus Omnitrophota bacterium]